MQFGAMETILPGSGTDAVAESAEAGFDGIEFSLGGPDPSDDPVWTPGGRNAIRRAAAAADQAVPSICLGYLNGGTVTSDDPEVRSLAHESAARSVDAAAALGATDVLVPFFGTAEFEDATDRDRAVEHLRALAPAAEAAGVTLAVESTLSVGDVLDVVERVDSPAVGVYHDTGNPLSWGDDPVEMIRALGDRMARIHFKDRDAGGASVRLGEGEVDFDAVAEALDDVGYDGWVVLETPGGDDPIAEAEANLRFSRDLL